MLFDIAEQVFDIVRQAPVYVISLQVVLIIWFLWVLLHKNSKPKILNSEAKKLLIAQWKPEPIVGKVDLNHQSLHPKIITGAVGHFITVEGKKCLNMASHNYLGFLENKQIKESAIKSLHKYGVGSCGPRGFYGTVDVHLELEERLAKFMNTEEAVVYSYGFSTIASAIPAYAKRGDVIFIDEQVSFASQKGLDASRSTINFFKHNDMEDLERLLIKQSELDKKNPGKAIRTRRFIIVEGIYMNTGTICPLPELIALRQKYKARIFVDETVSFGTLGKTGHGVTEHFNVNRDDVDMIIGSLDWAVGSIGGFCVGSSFVVDHQRLSGLGYCFSASLPPLLTQAAITALDCFEKSPEIFEELQNVCQNVAKELKRLTLLESSGDELSPVKHLYVKSGNNTKEVLKKIVDKCQEKGLAIVQAAYLEDIEKFTPKPSIRLTVSKTLSSEDIRFAVDTLEAVSKEIL